MSWFIDICQEMIKSLLLKKQGLSSVVCNEVSIFRANSTVTQMAYD